MCRGLSGISEICADDYQRYVLRASRDMFRGLPEIFLVGFQGFLKYMQRTTRHMCRGLLDICARSFQSIRMAKISKFKMTGFL